MITPKVMGIYEVFYSFFKKGIIPIEKDQWKHRRKLLSQVFNFDFITSHIPMMTSIADQVFEEVEKEQTGL